MKDFVKMMLAVICAFIVMQLVGFFLLFAMGCSRWSGR